MNELWKDGYAHAQVWMQTCGKRYLLDENPGKCIADARIGSCYYCSWHFDFGVGEITCVEG